MTEIRKMSREDLPQVAALEAAVFSLPWSEKGFLDSLNDPATEYLCVLSGTKVVGYCGFLQVLDEADITNVAVDEAFRGQGIGRRMLEQLMDAGRARGVKAFTLEVRTGNTAAVSLYEKLGFERAGIRRNFYDLPKEDALIMWKYE